MKAVSLGSRVSVVQINLQDKDPKSQEFRTCVLATVTQGNLATERGISLPTEPILKKEEIPDRDGDCEDHTVSDFIREIAPGSFKLDGRVPKRDLSGTDSDRRGKNCRRIWFTFADGSAWNVPSLGYLTDMVSGYLHFLVGEKMLTSKSSLVRPIITVRMTKITKRGLYIRH